MKKQVIGVMILISFGLCEKSFSSSCNYNGTEYSTAVLNGTTYYCAEDKNWTTNLWCPSSNDNGKCGGSDTIGCYVGGPIFDESTCMSNDAVYSN